VDNADAVIHFWERIFSCFHDMFVPHTESHRKMRITVDPQPSEHPSVLHKVIVLPVDYASMLVDPVALAGELRDTVLLNIVLKISSIFVS
jgi:hypothetical protein